MACAIVTCASDAALRVRWAAAGRTYYLAHFTPERMADRYLALYEECLRR
jgi:glycosyltransferase involved in cell wall biosynthesis